jgi:hypothetical protein
MSILERLKRITAGSILAVTLFGISLWLIEDSIPTAQVDGEDSNISVMDDCLPGDPAWNPTGGCGLKPHQGDVSMAEFDVLLRSPLTIPPNEFLNWTPFVAERALPHHCQVWEDGTYTEQGWPGPHFYRGYGVRRWNDSASQHRTLRGTSM